jgi:hypothetical protein
MNWYKFALVYPFRVDVVSFVLVLKLVLLPLCLCCPFCISVDFHFARFCYSSHMLLLFFMRCYCNFVLISVILFTLVL